MSIHRPPKPSPITLAELVEAFGESPYAAKVKERNAEATTPEAREELRARLAQQWAKVTTAEWNRWERLREARERNAQRRGISRPRKQSAERADAILMARTQAWRNACQLVEVWEQFRLACEAVYALEASDYNAQALHDARKQLHKAQQLRANLKTRKDEAEWKNLIAI